MNTTAIAWTNKTWNPTSGCSIVTAGCKNCYAMELSLKRGWTTQPWTQQHESENVQLKPHKLTEAYSLTNGERVFVNSMSDLFHRAIPDWYRAAVFAIMLDLPNNVFQVLTKRPENTVTWHTRYFEAIGHPEFIKFRQGLALRKGRWNKVYNALMKAASYNSPWGEHIWQGTSVEDARVLHRIDTLRECEAKVKFISAEPLLGAYPKDTDLSGIDWVIVGGESGLHMEEGSERWMQQEWAQGIRDLCLEQGVAYFYKQDSAKRTEIRTALQHATGAYFIWQQYPNQLTEPRIAIRSGSPKPLDMCNTAERGELSFWQHKVQLQRAHHPEQDYNEQPTTPPTESTPPKPDNQQLSLF